MPTISQLPSATQVAPSDVVPLSQGGETHSVSIGTLLASMQPAIISESGTLLGRTSLGAGGPEPVTVGAGLVLNDGTLAVSGNDPQTYPYTITGLAAVSTIAGNDLVAISQGGTDHAISYANLLNGLTIDLAQAAVAATDSDTLWVAQGNSTMLRQSFAAIWSWLATKQPSYKLPVVEISSNTTLDGTIHNGRILVCSQPVTLSPAPLNMGSGFHCDVLNLSSGNVIFGSGITSSSGASTLPSGQAAALRCVSYSGGSVVFASIAGSSSGGGTAPAAPGQVTGLTATSPTTSSIVLNWLAPGGGGAVGGYTVQYGVTGASTWSTFAVGLAATNTTVTGLAAGTSYDFQVYAVNGGGAGPASAVANAATVAVPGAVISITWQTTPTGSYPHGIGSLGVNAHINPANAPVQFGFSNSTTVPPTSWTVATYVNSDFWGAYVPTPPSPGTWYAWVEGTDGSTPTPSFAGFAVT